MKKYGITELARLFGISSEAIRKYEKKGVLNIGRNDQNQYRQYDIWDISALFHVRKYTQMGFGVTKTADLMNTTDIDLTIEEIRQRQRELTEEIIYRQKVMARLDEYERELSDYQELQRHPYRVEYLPEIAFCKLYDEFSLADDQTILKQAREWMHQLPFAFLGIISKRKDILAKKERFTTGICVLEKDLQSMQGMPIASQIILEPRLCVTTYLSGRYCEPVSTENFTNALVDLQKQGYSLTGDVFSKLCIPQKNGTEYCFHHKVWFPVDQP